MQLNSSLTLSTVDDNEHDEHYHEDNGAERSQLRGETSLPGIGVDEGGECLQSLVSDGEDGDGEVVDAHGDGEHESRYHAW